MKVNNSKITRRVVSLSDINLNAGVNQILIVGDRHEALL